MEVASYFCQILHDYYWLGKLLCIGNYPVGYDVELLVYFASLLSLELLDLLEKLLFLELPSNVSIEPPYSFNFLSPPELPPSWACRGYS
jgi:hypothetical protein